MSVLMVVMVLLMYFVPGITQLVAATHVKEDEVGTAMKTAG